MSVIVMGMEMPKQGWKCPLNGGGVCKLESLSCGKYIPALCPLRPMPETHGRLIDADNFEVYVQYEWEKNEVSNGDWISFREWLKDQSTIIEAEGD